jgi:hypothetical protein
MITHAHFRRQRRIPRWATKRAMITAVIVLSSGTCAAGQSPEYPPQESIEALQHHQPVDNEVLQREINRYGVRSVEQQQKREDGEIDELYGDIMRRSAPSPGEDQPHERLPERHP